MKTKITKVATVPLISSPASSYHTIYAALKRAQGMANWTRETGKTISLDHDLYEKVYLLVQICKDLHNPTWEATYCVHNV